MTELSYTEIEKFYVGKIYESLAFYIENQWKIQIATCLKFRLVAMGSYNSLQNDS